MIVVFLYPTQPPAVFVASRAQLIERARDLAAQTDTHPGASAPLNFDKAWTVLSRDTKAAHHFPDIALARHHIQSDPRLTHHERTTVLSALGRLE